MVLGVVKRGRPLLVHISSFSPWRAQVCENLHYGCVEQTVAGWAVAEPSNSQMRNAMRIAQCEDTFLNQDSIGSLEHLQSCSNSIWSHTVPT
eukprot:5227273-Amphidinium_carterae.1